VSILNRGPPAIKGLFVRESAQVAPSLFIALYAPVAQRIEQLVGRKVRCRFDSCQAL
jgi:hypothetical protein